MPYSGGICRLVIIQMRQWEDGGRLFLLSFQWDMICNLYSSILIKLHVEPDLNIPIAHRNMVSC